MKAIWAHAMFLLLLLLHTHCLCRTDTLLVEIKGKYSSICTELIINNNHWTSYTKDISSSIRDSISSIRLELTSHRGYDSLFLLIDSISLSGVTKYKVIDDFENYILGSNMQQDTIFPDRYWGVIMANNGTVGQIRIIHDNSKCLKYGGYNFMGSDFHYIPILCFGQLDTIIDTFYQNWTEYQTLSLSVKRSDYTSDITNNKQNKHSNKFIISQNQISKAIYIISPDLNKTFNVSVFNASGQRVHYIRDISENRCIWHVQGFSKGVYVIKAVCGKEIYMQRLLLN